MQQNRFIKCSDSFFVDADYQNALQKKGINCIDDIFDFEEGVNLTKKDLAQFRNRIQFQIDNPKAILFLKRYNKPPVIVQLKNWLAVKSRKSCAWFDYKVSEELNCLGIETARVISYGEQFGLFFEKRSFCIAKKIPDAESLENNLPVCFSLPLTDDTRGQRKEFIKDLALFICKFHQTGFRHRDLYLCHIFHSDSGKFYLIDLARTFKPLLFSQRYRVKDIAQLYYSAPGEYFSKTDRMRFYHYMTSCNKLQKRDKIFIKKVIDKAKHIAEHDRKHGKTAPFKS
jgi:hypothetical protein